jgi:hypothetical protein
MHQADFKRRIAGRRSADDSCLSSERVERRQYRSSHLNCPISCPPYGSLHWLVILQPEQPTQQVSFELGFARMPVNWALGSSVLNRHSTEVRRKQPCQRTEGRETPLARSRGPHQNSGTTGPNGRAGGPGERVCLGWVAERVGFEPTVRFCRTHAFQACALSHSAISPGAQTSCRARGFFQGKERRRARRGPSALARVFGAYLGPCRRADKFLCNFSALCRHGGTGDTAPRPARPLKSRPPRHIVGSR